MSQATMKKCVQNAKWIPSKNSESPSFTYLDSLLRPLKKKGFDSARVQSYEKSVLSFGKILETYDSLDKKIWITAYLTAPWRMFINAFFDLKGFSEMQSSNPLPSKVFRFRLPEKVTSWITMFFSTLSQKKYDTPILKMASSLS